MRLNFSKAAVLIIDLQADVFAGGALACVGTEELLPKAKRVLAAARQARLPIIHTKEVHRKEMVDFGRELEGAEAVHCLETCPIDGEFVISKRRYSCFFGTDLEILLKGLRVDTLILLGSMTNVCVHYTAVDAHQKDYYLQVIEDCCVGSDWAAHWAALTAMEYLQKGSRIIHLDFLNILQSHLTDSISEQTLSTGKLYDFRA
jgi:biuret amidohydrolase